MYFPKDMTFQYFFFDTYIGYFLQALPIALIVSTVYGFLKFRNDPQTPVNQKLFSCIFLCYITGLICLVIGLDFMHIAWYNLLYPMGSELEIHWFGGSIDLIPDFFRHIDSQTIGNFFMFWPFGILYPLSQKDPTWKKSVAAGFLTIVIIEVLQPVFGRTFDVNDVILNSLGVMISTSIFMSIKKVVAK